MDVIRDRRGQILLLVAVALGMFMDGLDGSIVNIALPSISESLNADTGTVSWVITVYFLVMAGLILIFGRISDKGAIKKVFMTGFLLFSAGSLFCALSGSIEVLLISRAVQGVGAAMLAASSLMLCVKYFPPEQMAFGLSVAILGSAVGASLGPALGGILTELGSWHWIFLINVPIGIAAVLFASRAIPEDPGLEKADFDVKGSAVLFIMLVAGLYSLESILSDGLNAISALTSAVFLVTLPVFLICELRTPSPVFDLGLFKLKRFDAAIISFLLINVCFMGAIYLLPFYLDIEMGLDPMTSGMYLLIPSLITLVFCSRLGRLSDRTERRIFVVGACAAMTAFLAIFSFITPEMSIVYLVIALICMGFVWALCGGPASSRIVENVPPENKGSGSSFMSFFMYFGGSLGTALFAALFDIGTPGVTDAISGTDFLSGFHFAMIVGVVLSVIALLISASFKEKSAVSEQQR